VPSVGTTHHLKLGNEYLIIRPNSYQKRPAPTFGARITTGDPDYNNLSIWQHWVQKCWVGGMGADEWVDDAMYKDAVGMDTTVHEKITLSRQLKRGSGAGWTIGGKTEIVAERFCVYKGKLYILRTRDSPGDTGDSRLYEYNPTTQTWTGLTMPGSSFLARAITTFDGKLFIGGVQTSGTDVAKLYYTTTPGSGYTTVTNPAGISASGVHSMRVYNTKLYVAFSTVVWRLKDDQTWDGSTAFYKVNANSGSNYIAAMETHLGFLYMLSQNGHLHRTDGNNTFDIWSWDGQTSGVSLRSYDGKLFVGTYEYTDTTEVGYGVLYQFTGAAVTELKRWGVAGRYTSIGQMVVYGRRLFYGASGLFGVRNGFGIACYDSVEDAHSIFAIQDDAVTYADASGTGYDWLVDDVIVFGGKMFCLVRGHGVFFTEDSFKDVERGNAQYTTSTTGGVLTSSLYDGGTPGLEKLWRRVVVYADLPTANTSLTLEYSLNGGVSWTAFTTAVGPSPADGQYTFNMQNITSTRFSYRITLKTTDETKSPVLRGVSVSYLPQPEPNWMWSFSIPVADKWELMDDTVETKNTNTLIAYLEGLFRSQQLVTFIDIDGVTWATNGPGVLIYDLNTVHYDVEAPNREADVRVTLLEAVETY
jgi:hypothetical protein